jgi:hypothetical protein
MLSLAIQFKDAMSTESITSSTTVMAMEIATLSSILILTAYHMQIMDIPMF